MGTASREGTVTREVTVTNREGLHARPASDFVLEAKKYGAAVTIRKLAEGTPVNAKSIARLLAQGITAGDTVEIAAQGEDAQAAVDGLAALVARGFGEP
jgi:phosphocarrier protein